MTAQSLLTLILLVVLFVLVWSLAQLWFPLARPAWGDPPRIRLAVGSERTFAVRNSGDAMVLSAGDIEVRYAPGALSILDVSPAPETHHCLVMANLQQARVVTPGRLKIAIACPDARPIRNLGQLAFVRILATAPGRSLWTGWSCRAALVEGTRETPMPQCVIESHVLEVR